MCLRATTQNIVFSFLWTNAEKIVLFKKHINNKHLSKRSCSYTRKLEESPHVWVVLLQLPLSRKRAGEVEEIHLQCEKCGESLVVSQPYANILMSPCALATEAWNAILHLKPDQLFNNTFVWSSEKEKIYYRFPPGLGGESPDSDAEWHYTVLCYSMHMKGGGMVGANMSTKPFTTLQHHLHTLNI